MSKKYTDLELEANYKKFIQIINKHITGERK
jgi:hypothetical protein